MKVVVYDVKPFENELLAKSNKKKHDITLISNSLNAETVMYAAGKNTVIISGDNNITAAVIEKLAGLGIKYLVTRSAESDHIDKEAVFNFGLRLSNLPFYSPLPKNAQANADQIIKLLDLYVLNRGVEKLAVALKTTRKARELKPRNNGDIAGKN